VRSHRRVAAPVDLVVPAGVPTVGLEVQPPPGHPPVGVRHLRWRGDPGDHRDRLRRHVRLTALVPRQFHAEALIRVAQLGWQLVRGQYHRPVLALELVRAPGQLAEQHPFRRVDGGADLAQHAVVRDGPGDRRGVESRPVRRVLAAEVERDAGDALARQPHRPAGQLHQPQRESRHGRGERDISAITSTAAQPSRPTSSTTPDTTCPPR